MSVKAFFKEMLLPLTFEYDNPRFSKQIQNVNGGDGDGDGDTLFIYMTCTMLSLIKIAPSY